MVDQTELTKVLESLVDDNEVLKRDNAELQSLLAESREDLHALQEEVEEQRANTPSHAGGKLFLVLLFSCSHVFKLAGTLHSRQQFYTGSVPSSTFKEHSVLFNFLSAEPPLTLIPVALPLYEAYCELGTEIPPCFRKIFSFVRTSTLLNWRTLTGTTDP